MGNDGGSIPDRRDLVKSKPKAEQADKANQTRARWGFCALSKKPLQEPVVSCRLGRLYNKDALIEYLLDPSLYGDGNNICGHVKGLKDVKVLVLTTNPARLTKLSDTDTPPSQFACPLNMKEMNGSVPFVYLRPCGCVFSESGLKALTGSPPVPDKEGAHDPERSLCPQCGTKFEPREDVFTINPGPEEEANLLERLALHLASVKSKPKKRKAGAVPPEAETPTAKRQHISSTPSTPSTNPTMASRSKQVVNGIAEQEKKRLATMSDAVKSIYRGKNEKQGVNWISQGTFTRYAA